MVGVTKLPRVALGLALQDAWGLSDGLATTPLMGWRSWNAYSGDVDQAVMEKSITAIAAEFAASGYRDVGLDDNWQLCGAGAHGTFHDEAGRPLVNASRFTDLKALTRLAHQNNLTAGWYANNCICSENNLPADVALRNLQGDVRALVEYEFDGIKLDGCGQNTNLSTWLSEIRKTGRKIVVENCHWGNDLRFGQQCPYHFARTSGDIGPYWRAMFLNLQSVARAPEGEPGCWNYPDMLEVGNFAGTAAVEQDRFDRTHFAAWCVTSSPLVLSFDLRDRAKVQRVGGIVRNELAIAVNQLYSGDAGRLIYSWEPLPNTLFLWSVPCDPFASEQAGWRLDGAQRPRWRPDPESDQDFCLRAQQGTDPKLAILVPCGDHGVSDFVLDAETGYFRSVSVSSACLRPSEGGFEIGGDCQAARQFFVSPGTGRLLQRVGPAMENERCVAVKVQAPSSANTLQLWAKQLPVRNDANKNASSAGHGRTSPTYDRSLSHSHHMSVLESLFGKDSLKASEEDTILGRQAVLLINADQRGAHPFTFGPAVLQRLFGAVAVPGTRFAVFDVWNKKFLTQADSAPPSVSVPIGGSTRPLRTIEQDYVVQIPPRGSTFLILQAMRGRGDGALRLAENEFPAEDAEVFT
ncbi:unnamed protein product [Amoebophrya sp. A120]|nr:unnamed protein product [Amoebophrya sp. A120]|eukprot:GSA120T00021660001.1